MKADITDHDALSAVEPGAVRAYLDAHGWHHVEPYGDHGDVYARDEAPEIVAPTSRSLRDYPRRISEIVSILARVEGRDALRVYRDLTTAASDLVRVRAPDAEEDGSVSLERGVALVTESRNLLLAAACASVRSAAAFRAGAVREIEAFRERVSLGVSANLCEAASRLAIAGDGIGVSLSWALTQPVGVRHAALSTVDFTRTEARTLHDAAHALRDREARSGERLRGVVVKLTRGVGASLGRAVLKTTIDGAMASVSVRPRPSDQKTFIEAFKRREDVVVVGELQRTGQRWILDEPREVTVVPQELDDPVEEDLIDQAG